ncbi:MAG: DUF1593 domain-containing protein [Vicinamibacterales bacterium]|nr:DUF1593 domain-containing protein [Vicinamibacterales bacterium]
MLTDIENEPDDAQSMVRLLTYSNQFDIEGLVATTSVHMRHTTAAWRIREIVEAYGKVRGNLMQHEPGWPTAEYLWSIIREGRPDFGMRAVGRGMDSPGSAALIAAVDRGPLPAGGSGPPAAAPSPRQSFQYSCSPPRPCWMRGT